MSAQTTAVNEAPEDDPWAAGTGEEPFAGEAADEFDEFDAMLADLSEEETDRPIVAPSQVRPYRDPLDAGLRHLQWVPILIEEARVDPKYTPERFTSRVCVAEVNELDEKTGKMVLRKHLLADKIEKALSEGGTETVRENIPMPYFLAKANHAVAGIQRQFDWEVAVPVFTVKTALPQPRGSKLGYPNLSGQSLRKATGATQAGESITPANMSEVAGRMNGRIVLAQLNIVQAKRAKYRPVLDENKQPISVLMNDDGIAVLLLKLDDETGYVYDNENGEIWEGDTNLLVPVPGLERRYALRDSSEKSGHLQEAYYPVTDYLKDTFIEVPERNVTIATLDGEEVEGEITLETVGAIAYAPTYESRVDIVLKNGQRAGRKVTAIWVGTLWQEAAPESDGGLADFKSDPVDAL